MGALRIDAGRRQPTSSDAPVTESTYLTQEPSANPEHDRAGRYKILKELSNASIVFCYLAEDQSNGEKVIVREVPKSFFQGSGFARFENEARLTSGLRCETYCHPREFEVRDRVLRVVYEYISGESLASRVRWRPLSPCETMLVARDLLSALKCVHDIGCVHRASGLPTSSSVKTEGPFFVAMFPCVPTGCVWPRRSTGTRCA